MFLQNEFSHVISCMISICSGVGLSVGHPISHLAVVNTPG